MLIIPFTPSQPIYTFTTTITDSSASPFVVRFDARWNTVDSSWYLDVREQNGDLIAGGVKVVLGVFLGRRVKHRLFRDGVLSAVDTTNQGKEAGLDDFGTRVKVIRFSLDEIARLHAIKDGLSR